MTILIICKVETRFFYRFHQNVLFFSDLLCNNFFFNFQLDDLRFGLGGPSQKCNFLTLSIFQMMTSLTDNVSFQNLFDMQQILMEKSFFSAEFKDFLAQRNSLQNHSL